MEQGKRKEDEQQLHAVRFAAGVAVLMACLERAALVSFFERWRVWVFLALNLLLLVILFTSNTFHTYSSSIPANEPSDAQEDDGRKTEIISTERKKNMQQEFRNSVTTKGEDNGSKTLTSESRGEKKMTRVHCVKEEIKENDDDDDENKKTCGLSKEELNERVEAFIAMFRQQYLVDHDVVRRRKSLRLPAHLSAPVSVNDNI